jgi:hypothetical protein
MGDLRGSWSCCRLDRQSVVTSVTAARAQDSSTTVSLVANAATRAWTVRLFTARGSPRLTCGSGGRVVAEQGVGAAGESRVTDQVGFGLTRLHPGHGVAQRDPLVQGGEGSRA